MSSDPTSEDTPDGSDTPLDLAQIFRHPAGLPTARYLVEALIREDAQRSATGIPLSQSHKIPFSVTRPMFRSSHSFTTDLKEILAFSEPQSSTSDQRNARTKGIDGSEAIEAQERSKAISWDQAEPVNFQNHCHCTDTHSLDLIEISPISESSSIIGVGAQSSPHNIQTACGRPSLVKRSSTVGRPPQFDSPTLRLSPTLGFSSDMELDFPFEDLKDFSTASNVEAPREGPLSNRKGRSSSSQISSHRSDESQFHSSDLSGTGQAHPHQLGHFFCLTNSLRSLPTSALSSIHFLNSPDGSQGQHNHNTTNSITYNTTNNTTHNLLSHIDLPPNNTNRSSINYPPGIKPLTSFKETENSNSHLFQDSSISNSRLTNPAASTHSLASHTPIRSIDSTIEPACNKAFPPINQNPAGKMPPKKRKNELEGAPRAKKRKNDSAVIKSKRAPKSKEEKPQPVSKYSCIDGISLTRVQARYKLDPALWMRILEFTPPSFLFKARYISRQFRDIVNSFDSLFRNCVFENHGADMPLAPPGVTPRQYLNLLQGKGCLEHGCNDDKTSKTSWSWMRRWCASCWKGKLEREDRVIKIRQNLYSRTTLTKMLECIPVGMHDSFMKPHDFVEDLESRPRGAPRLYKYYLTEDINRIITEYEALTPAPYVEDPTQSPEEKSASLAAHQALMDALDEKRAEFFAKGKSKNDEHMALVMRIEAGVRKRRGDVRVPNDKNRNSRRELFTKRATEDIPWVTTDFVVNTKCFKAATRIFRDGGTERGWLTLKPKILKEWEDSQEAEKSCGNSVTQKDDADEIDDSEDDETNHGTTQKRSLDTTQSQSDNLSRLSSVGISHLPPQSLQARIMFFQAHTRMQQSGNFASSLASRSASSFGRGISFGSSLTANSSQSSSPSIPVGGSPFFLGSMSSSTSIFQSRASNVINNFSTPLMNHGLPSTSSSQSGPSSTTTSRTTTVSNSTTNNPSNASSSRPMSISSLLQTQTPSPNQHLNSFT